MHRWLRLPCLTATLLFAAYAPAVPADKPSAVSTPGAENRAAWVDSKVCRCTVEVFGAPRSFLVATGSSATTISERWRSKLVNRSTSSGTVFARNGVVEFYDYPPLKIAGVTPPLDPEQKVACLDLSAVTQATGLEVDGVLGNDCLRHFVVSLDSDRNVIRIDHELPSTPKGQSLRLTSQPAFFGIPVLRAEIAESGFFDCGVETGSTRSLDLDAELFDKLCRLGHIKAVKQCSIAAGGGPQDVSVGILDSMRLGRYEVRNISVIRGSRVLIGLGLLRRFNCVLDFPNRRAYFEPSRYFHEPEPHNLAGFGVRRVDGRVLAIDIWDGLPAATAGLKDDDVITHVNGVQTEKLLLEDIRQLRERDASTLKLTIVHDGTQRDVALKLVRPPDPFPAEAERPVDEDFLD